MIVRQFEDKQEWLAWRKKGICASDISAIIGKSKWTDIDDIFLQKIGEQNEKKDDWAMARGREYEPLIRAKLESTYDTTIEVCCGEHPGDSWARASFDGINFDKGLLFEIKTAGKEDHQTAKAGLIPDHYYPQVQWLMHVSGFSEAHYVSAHENKQTGWEIEDVIAQYNPGYIDKIMPQLLRFWNCVQTGVPPTEPIANDIALLFDRWAANYEKIAILEEEQAVLKKTITDITPQDGSLSHAGFKSQWIIQKGKVNYKKIPELESINLDQYRGGDTTFVRITKC